MQQRQAMQYVHQPQFAHQPPPPPGQPMSMMGGAAFSAPGTKVFVGQLPYSKNESDLWQLFGSIGPVSEVAMMMNSQTAEAAVAALDGFMFSGSPRAITVSIAQESAAHGQKRTWASANPSAAATIQ